MKNLLLVIGTYTGSIYTASGSGGNPIGIMTDTGNGAGATPKIGIETGNVNGGTFASGQILVRTGDSSVTNSGDITIRTGISGANRGKVLLNAATLQLAIVAAPLNPANGDVYFDGTDLRMYVLGAWKVFTLT